MIPLLLFLLAGPELAMREFSSGQIKKGVRAIGMGGDGATVGNYSLVWKDADTALVDYGVTSFSDTGNQLEFAAVGYNTPAFWNGASLFIIAMAEWGSGIHLPNGTVAELGDQAVFIKFAKPLPHNLALGALLSWERSAATALDHATGGATTYTTSYLPSGGAGVSWSPLPLLLAGVRVLLNNDEEHIRDVLALREGWNRAWEFRAGVSAYPWRGGLVDVGYVGLARGNAIDGSSTYSNEIVAGIEQLVLPGRLWLRAGWDEHSPTAGFSLRLQRFKLDIAYVHDLAVERSKHVFGANDDAVLMTLNFDYAVRH